MNPVYFSQHPLRLKNGQTARKGENEPCIFRYA